MKKDNIQIVRTKIDEETSFVSVKGKSPNRSEIDSFVNNLIEELKTPKEVDDKPVQKLR